MVMDRRHRVTPVDYCYYYGRLRQPVVPQPTGTSASSAIDLAAAVDHLPSVHGLLCRSESGVDALRYRRQPLVVVVDLPVRFDVSASGGWPSKQTPIVPRSRTRRGFYSRIGRTCLRRRTDDCTADRRSTRDGRRCSGPASPSRRPVSPCCTRRKIPCCQTASNNLACTASGCPWCTVWIRLPPGDNHSSHILGNLRATADPKPSGETDPECVSRSRRTTAGCDCDCRCRFRSDHRFPVRPAAIHFRWQHCLRWDRDHLHSTAVPAWWRPSSSWISNCCRQLSWPQDPTVNGCRVAKFLPPAFLAYSSNRLESAFFCYFNAC